MSEQSTRPVVVAKVDGDAPDKHDLAALDGPGPEFTALIADLHALAQRQENVAKAEQRRVAVNTVMRRVAEEFTAGRLSALEVSRIHALRLRLDDGLLPEER